MTEDKRIVWTNIDLDPEDWYDGLRELFPNLDENALYEKMWSLNNEYLDDERANLDLYVGSPILVLADLGLWNGRHRGYGEIKSGNLMDCLKTDCEYAEWYGNLILVDKSVHSLIHAIRKETIENYKEILNLSQKQVERVNKLRGIIGLESI